MKNVLVTGSNGLVGKYLVNALHLRKDINLYTFNRNHDLNMVLDKDYIFHLAGVIKPKQIEEYESSNYLLTKSICDKLESYNQKPIIIFSSSIRATCDTPYGISKKRSEEVIKNWAIKNNTSCIIYRFASIISKSCKPNYNSVISTFCHNAFHDLPLIISNEYEILEFIHINDVIKSLVSILDEGGSSKIYMESDPIYKISLGDLANTIRSFKKLKNPNFDNEFDRYLYEVYINNK